MSSKFFMQEWLKKRSPRERLYIFFFGFIFFYLVYFIFFLRPLLAQKKGVQEQINALQTQQVVVQQQINVIKAAIKTPIFLQLDAEQTRLIALIEKMQNQLENLKPALFSGQDLPKFTESILSQQRNNVVLISIEELPIEPWPPQSAEDKTTAAQTATGIYQHILQIEFQNNYFRTIDYLMRLEKISAYIYWDSMDYKVLQHPKANVVIKFHVLSMQKS